MATHYINNFVVWMENIVLEYYNPKTIQNLNNFVSQCINTYSWNIGDSVRVANNCYGEFERGVEGLFIWNGSELIYPFYNGKLNKYGCRGYEIDQLIHSSGYVPNTIKFIYDFEPGNGENRVLFTDLSYFKDEILSNKSQYCVDHNYNDEGITCFKFRDYCIVILGETPYEFYNYIENNRPYDFNIDDIIIEYEMSVSKQDMIHTFGTEKIMLIHPRFFNIDFDNSGYDSDGILSRVKSSRNKTSYSCDGYNNTSYNTSSKTSSTKKFVLQETRDKCIGKTGKGKSCSRAAKNGYSFCGIHLRAMAESDTIPDELRCVSKTGKGERCNRVAKNGYDYCSIHLRSH